MPAKINGCRVCGNQNLVQVLDLGEQMLTGVFPRTRDASVTIGPLRLVKCMGDQTCGLLQLEHSFDLGEMYGDNYGYRSGLNQSMVLHLREKVRRIAHWVDLHEGDLVLDIGSNDGTTLAAYPAARLDLLGIDPTAGKFREYYPDHVDLVADFFSAAVVQASRPGKQARVVTSFSMLYDLESPLQFMREIHEVLADDGVWVFEQSYMPAMLEMNAYDTVCHEHLEYYALHQVKWMADRAGFRIIDVEFNDINGGSFSVTVAKTASGLPESNDLVRVLQHEVELGLDTLAPYQAFAARVAASRQELRDFTDQAHREGRTLAALGASTKGNVLLQYCGLDSGAVAVVGEVNPEKYGCYTPGTWIPIRPESEVLASKPDYLVVLPWHFRAFFLGNARFAGMRLLFPLPRLEVVQVAEVGE
ncbi:class I SAM-dependent methyltransferase [Rhodanobacter sp. C05]|uniref:class I SAM-dependent methyltransferase n=1 Tax=Rhodanobacter sp. C05 TaxID=1945855 RepID=UPI0009842809|nr:class I SAM-dependent methyltransferase [Rhodanobacter sp. C05]OOG42479.1 methyltransferase [Rhodanobacter sp. C05]